MKKVAFVLFIYFCSYKVLANSKTVKITYLSNRTAPIFAVNEFLKAPQNAGIAGALLAIGDSNTTGKFLGQHFDLETVDLSEQAKSKINWLAVLPSSSLVLADLGSQTLSDLVAYNKTLRKPHLIINVTERDNSFRQNVCEPFLFHTAPSYAQVTDALGQWLLSKRLKNIFLIDGDTEQDSRWIESFKRTAKRYKLSIKTDKKWSFDSDLRRTVSQEIPLFTQTARAYDVVVVADTYQRFGQYIPYNTFYPRPVIGTAGLIADTWHQSIEQWGAKQLQNRFIKLHGRYMQHQDFDSYVAIRAIADAVQQAQSISPAQVSSFMRSEAFQLAAYKGRKLTFREFNGQLRMPIELTHPFGLVSRSPQPGFMHPTSELDTLGFDKREVCQLQ